MVGPNHFDARLRRAVRKIQIFTLNNFNHNAPGISVSGTDSRLSGFPHIWKDADPDIPILK
jgi:hypothetical protein